MIHSWWNNKYNENYWLEVTGRDDLGMNLKAPQSNEHGAEFWSYSLLKCVQSGDIVFHYARAKQAIIARSIASGELWEDAIMWAARGISARTAGIQPHTRPGWYIGLEKFRLLQTPVSLSDIRDKQITLLELRSELVTLTGEPLYFPFEISSKRPLRPMQGYLFKLPSFFVEQFPQLLEGWSHRSQRVLKESREEFGSIYRTADENTSVGQRDPFSVDPTLVERALHSHASTQNSLAAFLREIGLEPRSPKPTEPNFDLAWASRSMMWVAEVKSLTEVNEEKQLRLGLGQLLRYRQLLSQYGIVRAVLVTEHSPRDRTWENLCEELGILLVWPENWHQKLSVQTEHSAL